MDLKTTGRTETLSFQSKTDQVQLYASHQLLVNRRRQLQIPIDDGRVVQTEHHGVEDLLVCKE